MSLINERDHAGCSMGISAVADPRADCLSDGLEDLVVSPMMAPLAQCLGVCSRVPVLEYRGHRGVST